MNIVVDTSVWSLVFRREHVDERHACVRTLRACEKAGHDLFLIGPILLELLGGLESERQFSRLLKELRPIPLAPLHRSTYVLAARITNHCRSKGVQAGPIDFLIAAACIELSYPLLTADQDFKRIAACTDLMLLPSE